MGGVLLTCPGIREICQESYYDRDRIKADFYHTYGMERPDIEHVVVLMLENRTFDNIFGNWMNGRMQKGEVKPSKWDVGAKQGKQLYDYHNVVVPRKGQPTKFPVWSLDRDKEDIFSPAALGVPNGDPAEKFTLLNRCVYETDDPGDSHPVTMGGFAQQYYEREMHDLETLGHTFPDRTDFDKKRSPAMHCFLPEQVAVFTQLADEFGVSDTYFSSAPCQTWPNRLFVMNGHCYGYVNNLADRGADYDHDNMKHTKTAARLLQFGDQTIFEKLLANGVEFAIYGGGMSLAVCLSRTLSAMGYERVYSLKDFAEHVDHGLLAPYTWIEPQYLKYGNEFPNDMHPPHNVLHAQKLVAELYETLRRNEETWSKTLFLITCDEGVGVFDHVPPPEAPHPLAGEDHMFIDQVHPDDFAMNPFCRYGTRVPLVMASPLLKPGSVIRPSADQDYPFDHCSIIRTVLDLFVGPDASLTDRDYLAPSLATQLLPKARPNLGPKFLYQQGPIPKDDPTLLRAKNHTSCHDSQLLFDMANTYYEEENFGESSSTEMLLSEGRWLLGGLKSGLPNHLEYHRAYKTSPFPSLRSIVKKARPPESEDGEDSDDIVSARSTSPY